MNSIRIKLPADPHHAFVFRRVRDVVAGGDYPSMAELGTGSSVDPMGKIDG